METLLAMILSLLKPIAKAFFEVVLTTPAVEKEVKTVETNLNTDIDDDINFASSKWLLDRS